MIGIHRLCGTMILAFMGLASADIPIYIESFGAATSLQAAGFQQADNWTLNGGAMVSNGSGDWSNLSVAVTPKFSADRLANGKIKVHWSLYLDSDPSSQSWRELNKVWTEFRGPNNQAYIFLFKPNRDQDLNTSFQFQLSFRHSDGTETILAQTNSGLITPDHSKIDMYVWLDTYESSGGDGTIEALYEASNTEGGDVLFKVKTEDLTEINSLAFIQRTGLASQGQFYPVRVDDIEVVGAHDRPSLVTIPPNSLFGFIGDGEQAFGRKFHSQFVDINDNQDGGSTIHPNLLSGLDPTGVSVQEHSQSTTNIYNWYDPTIIRKVTTLNTRQDGLGFSNGDFQHMLISYFNRRKGYYAKFTFAHRPKMRWYHPDVNKLLQNDQAQIDAFLQRNQGKTLYWEICNEPNIPPVAISPDDYGDLYAAYRNYIVAKSALLDRGQSNQTKNVFGFGTIFNTNMVLPESRELVKEAIYTSYAIVEIGGTAGLTLLGAAAGTTFGPIGTAVGGVSGFLLGAYFSYVEGFALDDLTSAVEDRMWGLTPDEWVRRALTEAKRKGAPRPEAMTLHDYPLAFNTGKTVSYFMDRAKNTHQNLLLAVNNVYGMPVLNQGSPSTQVWVTEFGNINPERSTSDAASLVGTMMDSYWNESKVMNLTHCMYYKPLGFDAQFKFLPSGWRQKQGLVSESDYPDFSTFVSKYPSVRDQTVDPFPCGILNSIGTVVYGKMNGDKGCQDLIQVWQ